MHSIQLTNDRIVAIHHNPDWSGETLINYWIDPANHSSFTSWCISNYTLQDLVNGYLPAESYRALDGSEVPLKVITRAIAVIAVHMERERIRGIINSI